MPQKRRFDDEDEKPVSRTRRPSNDDEEDDRPVKRKRPVDDEDEDERPTRKKVRDEDDEDERPRKKTVTAAPAVGWGAVAKKKAEYDDNSTNDMPRDFWLKDGESSTIQFLDDEPYAVPGHSVRLGSKKNFEFTPCQLMVQKHCMYCRDGIKKSERYAFKIIDHRGSWDKEKKKFKYDKPVEKFWVVGIKVAESLKARVDRTGKQLTEMVLDVARSGSGTSSTYNFEVAFDKDENKLRPVRVKQEFGSTKELIKPLTDDKLESLGFSSED